MSAFDPKRTCQVFAATGNARGKVELFKETVAANVRSPRR
jgi:hypothetical protein